MEKFSALFEKIDQTQSTNEKVQYMKEYFSEISASDGAWALFFLCGHRLKRFISANSLLQWCLEVTRTPVWLVEECYAAVGDSAETIALLLPKNPSSEERSLLTLSEWMDQRILPLRGLPFEEQEKHIKNYWQELNHRERFILNKILTGSFRVGVSQLLALRALSEVFNVPRESLSQRLMGHWEPTAAFFENLKNPIHDLSSESLNPYPFYLASPLENDLEELGDPREWQAEWKWDGIRGQCMRRENSYAIWSRGNELVSHQFPELMNAMEAIPSNTVLDGEILAYHEGKPLSYGTLQKRLGRKKVSKDLLAEIPLVFMIYDLLEYEGRDMRQEPLSKRREIIEKWAHVHPRILISPLIEFKTWDELKAKKEGAKSAATEGIMLKKKDSKYGVGRQRGNWWKFKVDPMTIDAVLLYAQAGTGRRANLYTDYTFGVWHGNELIPIAKAYSGLNQEEIDKLDRWIRRNTMEKFGPARKVKAEQVFEIAFEGIQISKRHKSGVALRFPRISRWRVDKPVEECDTLESIKENFLHEK